MGDLFNGWDEDGEPSGWDEDDYQKRSQEYYDRKVERAEEVAMPVVVILVCVLVAMIFFRLAWRILT